MMQTQILSSPVDPATTAMLVGSLPTPPDASTAEIALRRQSALEFAAVLRPRDPMEAAMAVRIVTSHFALMDNMRCAVQPELPAHLMLGFQGRALALARLMDTTQAALERRQMRPALQAEAIPEVEGAKLAVEPAVSVPAKAEPAKALAPQPPVTTKPSTHQPATAKPSAPVPAASAPAISAPVRQAPPAKSGAPLTASQQELLRRELARRTETSAAALLTTRAA